MKTFSEPSVLAIRSALDCGSPLVLSTLEVIPQAPETNPERLRFGALQILATAGLVLFTEGAFGQSWQTVDDFQYVLGKQTENWGLAVAPSGTLFASGHGYDSLGGHGLVMASPDSGNTWSAPLDVFVYPGSGGGYTRYDAGMACDSTGKLYVAGRVGLSTGGDKHWLVRQGTDGGLNWATVDDFVAAGAIANVQPFGITVDTAGNVYVAGWVAYTNGVGAWTVRKGVGGTSFSTVDSFGGNANAVFAHPSAGVFAAGYASVTVKRSASVAWIVRRSLDGGATWSTVDTFQLSSGDVALANGIGADAQGNVYVVGRADVTAKGQTYAHWVVRKSADGGNTWSTVDSFQPAINVSSTASRFVADSNGNLFVSGQASGSTWLVRENPGGTGTWATVDSFQYVAGSTSEPYAIAADAFGNVFVGGWADGPSTSPAPHWLVRKK